MFQSNCEGNYSRPNFCYEIIEAFLMEIIHNFQMRNLVSIETDGNNDRSTLSILICVLFGPSDLRTSETRKLANQRQSLHGMYWSITRDLIKNRYNQSVDEY